VIDQRVALKRIAVEAARAAGAGAVRVTSATPDVDARRRMRESFARGDLETWGFDDAYAERASDPATIAPEAQSVICCAFAYATSPPRGRDSLSGRVSNYAWSSDYHARVRSALQRIADALDAACGKPVATVACDTHPLSERAFAARAGLGWIGKHTNLIAPKLGSYVFLGEVFCTLEIESACPTGALRGDYTIDARLCISDLTQRTGAIPRDLRPLVGQWVWGCDACQEVCPPTRLAGDAADPDALPLDANAAEPSLLELLELRSGAFKRRYRATAMGWRGGAVLRRNAAVALGNALDRAAVPALARALEGDPHSMVRGHAAWALGRIGAPAAMDALRRRRSVETDIEVCEEIEHALRACAPSVRSAS
jgi:epoxyqueuosine reductase